MPPQRTTQFILSLVLAVWLTSVASASEKLSLASPFTDHAVLQRDMPVPVWGRAEPGAKVVVRFADQEKSATADKDGKWMLKLDRLKASMDGRELVVVSQAETLRIQDVLVGEVWLSNGFTTGSSTYANPADKERPRIDPAIRVFEMKFNTVDEPQEFCQGEWQAPQVRHELTMFAQGLHARLGVPVGVINPPTNPYELRPGSWIRRSALASSDYGVSALRLHEDSIKRFEALVAAWEKDPVMMAKREAMERGIRKANEFNLGNPEPKPRPEQHPKLLPGRPSAAFNGMIAPLIPFAVRGLFCSDRSPSESLAIIDAWRSEWSQPGLFAVRSKYERGERQMQDNVLSVSKVRYAVPGFSHTDGELSAELAALAVLEAFYREDIAWPVPQCDRITVDGKKMKLHFTACVGGLLKGRRDIEGFEIQDANGKWGRANAEIAGDTVIVSSDDIPNPVRVRLSPVHRRSRHEEYELWNKAGFPVEPFDLSVNSKP